MTLKQNNGGYETAIELFVSNPANWEDVRRFEDRIPIKMELISGDFHDVAEDFIASLHSFDRVDHRPLILSL